jgi:hypothetical protein
MRRFLLRCWSSSSLRAAHRTSAEPATGTAGSSRSPTRAAAGVDAAGAKRYVGFDVKQLRRA